MKKIFITMLLALGLATSVSAHHMAAYDDAGSGIPETSPHLDMVFY